MILDILNQLGPWAWWIVGVILLGLELIVPGSFFVWIGIAAILTGILALFTDFAWQVLGIIFAVVALVSVVVGRRYFAKADRPSDQPLLNQRAARFIGRTYVLAEPIVDGQGAVRIDDSTWRVRGPDLPSGVRVRIDGADGPVLLVTEAG